VRSLAERIFREDFPDLYGREGGDQRFLFETLEEAFRYFDPAKGDPARAVEMRFLRFFRRLFSRRLGKREARDRRGRRRERGAMEGYARLPRPRYSPVAEAYGVWSKALYEAALPRVDHRTRTFLGLRLAGRGAGEIAAVLGVAPKTVSNAYGPARLAERFRAAVRELVLGLPEESRLAVLAHLLFDVGLTEAQAERLLCLPGEVFLREVEALAGWDRPIPGPEEALRLIRGTQRGGVGKF
jgi:hypothetical protein